MFISFNGGHGGVWCLHAKIYKFIVYYVDDSAGRLRDGLSNDVLLVKFGQFFIQ